MSTPQDVRDIIAASGGSLAGRTRLQKSGYFLEVEGVGSGFDFNYHYYGPYSEELATAATDASALRLISIIPVHSQSGFRYEVFKTDQPHSTGSGTDLERRKEILNILDRYDSLSLELAATAHFLAENGFEQDPWSETKKRKAGKANEDRIRKAKELLLELGFDSLAG